MQRRSFLKTSAKRRAADGFPAPFGGRMEEYIIGLSRQMDDAANMDW